MLSTCRSRFRPLIAGLALLLVLGLLAGCVPKPPEGGPAALTGNPRRLNGAGSSFVFPLFSKMFAEYARTHGGVQVNYNSVGSGAGIRQLLEKTVHFGASDAPMSDQELQDAGAPVLHIPVTLGAVAVVYNVPGAPDGLRIDPGTLADMFLGRVGRWNDPRIAALNPGARLPDLAMAPAYRTDGSGTTFIFTDYLSAVSGDFNSAVGRGKSVKWPVGLGAKGNEGVTAQVQNTPGGIGYVELAYATQNEMSTVALQNQAGEFVQPSPAGVSAAASGSLEMMPADFRVSIVNAPGHESYPISGFTWALVYRDHPNTLLGRNLANLMWWVVHDGQQYAARLHYAPLPPDLITRIEDTLRQMTAGGQPALNG